MSTTSLKILMHLFLFSQMTPLYIIQPNVLVTCTGYLVKIFPHYITGQKFGILTPILLKLLLCQYLTRGISTPLYFSIIFTFQKPMHINIWVNLSSQSLLAYSHSPPSSESNDQNKSSSLILKFITSPLSPYCLQNKHITDF